MNLHLRPLNHCFVLDDIPIISFPFTLLGSLTQAIENSIGQATLFGHATFYLEEDGEAKSRKQSLPLIKNLI